MLTREQMLRVEARKRTYGERPAGPGCPPKYPLARTEAPMKPEELSDMFPVEGGTLELRYRLPGQLGGSDSLRFIVLLDKVALAGFAAAVQPDPPVQGREFPQVSNVSVMCEGVLIPVRCPPEGETPVDIDKLIANTREQMRIGWEPYARPAPKATPEE